MTEWCCCQDRKICWWTSFIAGLKCLAQPLYLKVWKILELEFWFELLAHKWGFALRQTLCLS